MAQISFDAGTVAPQQAFVPVPAGVYQTMIVDSEIKPTKSGTGQMVIFTLQIVDGQHAGRKLFARINVRNANSEAERIGQSQLSALCHAAGVLQLQDTAQLHNRVVRTKVKIRKDTTGQYDDQNECTGFEAVSGVVAGAPSGFAVPQAAQPAPPVQPSAAPRAPWAK